MVARTAKSVPPAIGSAKLGNEWSRTTKILTAKTP